MRSKGVSPLVAAVMLIAMSVVLSVMVSSWISTYGAETSKTLRNTTQSQLQCQFANIRVKSAVFDCSSSCMTGVPYKINATVENTGKISAAISRAVTKLSNGQVYQLETDDTSVGVGASSTVNFNGILAISSPKIPVETIDTRAAYVNDGNTLFLCHFDSTTNCTASGNSTADVNTGTSFASARFSAGVQVNESDALDYNATGNFNTTHGTVEFFVTPANSSASCSGCTFFYANTSTGDALKVYTAGGGFAFVREKNTSSVITGSSYSAGTTYHVAAAWGSGMRLYVDGVLQGTSSDNGNISGTPARIRIGRSNLGNNSDSVIDELRISKVPRFVSANLTYNVTFSSIERVRLYNFSNSLIDDSGSLGGITAYNKTVANLNVSEYKIEVTKTDGEVVTEFYPFTQAQSCFATTALTSIIVAADNCPSALDSIPGKDVTFVNCI
jgi:flagellin-like protein